MARYKMGKYGLEIDKSPAPAPKKRPAKKPAAKKAEPKEAEK